MSDIKLSIITINKNNAAGLEKTILSIINQTYFDNIEYIVVDGASSDDSISILDKYKDKITKIVSEEDTGIYQAMNKGTNLASGEYLLFLNSGDILFKDNTIEEVYPLLNTYDIIYGKQMYNDVSNSIFYPTSNIDYSLFLRRKTLPHQATFILKDLLIKLPYDENLKIAGDSKFFFNAICIHNATYKRINHIIVVYDVNGVSRKYKVIKEHEKQKYLIEGANQIKDEKIKYHILKDLHKYNFLINRLTIDYVFPYVNSSDLNWITLYEQSCKKHNIKCNIKSNSRYRDYGTLKYLLRGIEQNMPWIRNIYMIVEQESQVPDWVNTENIKIIYHKDIIPEELLPTYNSGTIEMFLKNIPGLSNCFIYGNDDMFLTNSVNKSDFFDENQLPKLKIKPSQLKTSPTTYQKRLINSNHLAAKDCNVHLKEDAIIACNHAIKPMKKSTWEYLWKKYKNEIYQSTSPYRNSKNYTQELIHSWQFLSKHYNKDYSLNFKYMNLKDIESEEQLDEILKDNQMVCLNDTGTDSSQLSFEEIKNIILKSFSKIFPNKSKYEL